MTVHTIKGETHLVENRARITTAYIGDADWLREEDDLAAAKGILFSLLGSSLLIIIGAVVWWLW